MNYDDLSDEQVAQRLREHDEADWTGLDGHEVIDSRDVLYYLDAFGDLSLAINCQGVPKDLPDSVIKALNECDVFGDWEGKVTEETCPLCDRTLYDFSFAHIQVIIDEYGGYHDRPQYLDDKAGLFWNVGSGEPMMCQSCWEHKPFNGWRPEPSSNSVRVFYGESDEFSRFSHQSGVIRWDSQWDGDYDKSTDLFNLREDDGNLLKGHEIAAAFAKGRNERNEMMKRIGFRRVHVKELDVTFRNVRKLWRHAQEVLEEWATLDSKSMTNEPTQPGLDFTYIIDGRYRAWVPEEHFEKFKAELIYQSLRGEESEEYREENEDLLSDEYYGETAA